MRTRFLVGLIAVIVLASASLLAALLVRANEVDHFDQTQREEAIRSAHQAEAVARLSVGELASAAAFLQAENDLSRHEFEVIGESLLSRGALTAVAFIPRVRDEERPGFESRLGFPIIERKPGGGARPAGVRDIYFPVAYAVAEEPAKAPFGYDIASDETRAPALMRAGVQGRPAATETMPLLIGGYGINVYNPVYRDGAATGTPAERRAALVGFAGGAFRVADLAAPATASVPDSAEIQIRVGSTTVAGQKEPLEDAEEVPIAVADQTWLLVVSESNRPDIALPLMIAIVGVSLAALMGALVITWSRGERMRELQRQASQDPLTGLKNRRRFEEDLRLELARSRRQRSTGALLMLDIDDFKRVNDTLGHPTGDKVIEEIAGVLDGRMRQTDVLARVGGDEFAVVLPDCDAGEATAVSEEVARAVRDHIPVSDGMPKMTVSVGVAMFGIGADLTFEEVMADADAALYAAKDAGRDGVRMSDSSS